MNENSHQDEYERRLFKLTDENQLEPLLGMTLREGIHLFELIGGRSVVQESAVQYEDPKVAGLTCHPTTKIKKETNSFQSII